jgi:hypothetical protein
MASPMGGGFGAALKPIAAAAPEPDGDESEDSLLVLAQDLIDAVKTGDAKLVAEALRAANTVCMDEYDEGGQASPDATKGI